MEKEYGSTLIDGFPRLPSGSAKLIQSAFRDAATATNEEQRLHNKRKAIDDLSGAASEEPQGIKVLTELERLNVWRLIEGWIKLIITFGMATVTLGLGMLVLRVMYYDIGANKEIRFHLEKVVTTEGAKTKLEMDKLRLAMKLFTKRQIDDASTKSG
ncbi:hypothetical protein BDZ91DRAFT_851176 [Kalaharituber pfeilii]|nr:hypothetical protein BDZ91DRAFT_851176 [Kalaharituber pfeilii]